MHGPRQLSLRTSDRVRRLRGVRRRRWSAVPNRLTEVSLGGGHWLGTGHRRAGQRGRRSVGRSNTGRAERGAALTRRSTSEAAERRYSLLSGIVRLWIAGPFVDVCMNGSEHIPTTGRVLIACNHPSMLNTLIPWAVLDRNPAVLVIGHAFKIPALGGVLRALGNVPVRRDARLRWLPHRDHRLDRAASAKSAVDVLSHEGVVQLYPEGKIARGWWHRGSVIQDLAPGVATLARVTGSPIVPFGIRLGWRLSRRGLQHTVRINVGPPIFAAEAADDADLLHLVRAALRRLSGLPYEEASAAERAPRRRRGRRLGRRLR